MKEDKYEYTAKIRESYLLLANLIETFNHYAFSKNYEVEKILIDYAKESKNTLVPLPYGGYGNAFSLACEMHMFEAATFMIIFNDRIGLDLDNCTVLSDGTVYTAAGAFVKAINFFQEVDIIDKRYQTNILSRDILKDLLNVKDENTVLRKNIKKN